ncbi:hypothetical protein B0T17DRAFT_597729 [Bombardia bombarda]|uniref:BTB domain-containing protein n=1 Tax=Bombardia bombarda TaxID=252184 RepID=A0AA39X9Q4_9PEZI|nr:hypothetical protein B0T17DRAFT_597729 [Bombardia bombarda]
MAKEIVLDPDGDVRIVLTQREPHTVAVISSKILSLASPVFNILLNGPFKEAADLKEKRSSSELYELNLPEDDPEAVIILLRLVHFKAIESIPLDHMPLSLERLAFLCDKYECTEPFKFCGTVWLRDWLEKYPEGLLFPATLAIDDVCRLLVFAYVADLPNEFMALSWRLVMFHKGPIVGQHTQAVPLIDHPLLKQDVAQQIDAKRAENCAAFHNSVMAPMNVPWLTLDAGCFCAAKAIGVYIAKLRAGGIMLDDLEFSNHTFHSLLEQHVSPSFREHSCSRMNCKCKSDLVHVSAADYSTMSMIDTWCSSEFWKETLICLDCIKTGGVSKAQEKCRVRHGKS